MTPFDPNLATQLPTLKQQFVSKYFWPARQQVKGPQEVAFEEAQRRYEAEHGHQFPFSFVTFCRELYGQ